MSAQEAGIAKFDPREPRPFYVGWLEAFGRTSAGRRFGITVLARVDPWLLRATGGRLGLFFGAPTAALTTLGARSGSPRTAAVFYFTDDDDVILVASNFGQDHHPAWYHNLVAHPEATLERGGVRARYSAVEVKDDSERERLFMLADKVYAGYADYRVRTAAIGRRIPLMRLRVAP